MSSLSSSFTYLYPWLSWRGYHYALCCPTCMLRSTCRALFTYHHHRCRVLLLSVSWLVIMLSASILALLSGLFTWVMMRVLFALSRPAADLVQHLTFDLPMFFLLHTTQHCSMSILFLLSVFPRHACIFVCSFWIPRSPCSSLVLLPSFSTLLLLASSPASFTLPLRFYGSFPSF